MALVLGVSLAAIWPTSIFQVNGISIHQDRRCPGPHYRRRAGDNGEGRHDDLISRAQPQCGHGRFQRRRAVATATPYLRPTRRANSSSNWRTNGPSEEIHPVSMHFCKYRHSLPCNKGSLTGMNSDICYSLSVWESIGLPVNLVLSRSPA